MQLTVDNLNKQGGFVGGLVKTEITFANSEGKEFTFDTYIRKLSYSTVTREIETLQKGGDVNQTKLLFCICHEDGSPVFSQRDLTGINDDGSPIMVKDPESGQMRERGALDTNLAKALIKKVNEVSGLGKNPENSTTKTNSGTNLS